MVDSPIGGHEGVGSGIRTMEVHWQQIDYEALRRLARSLLRDEHAAEDAVQDGLALALEAAPAQDLPLGEPASEGPRLETSRLRGFVRNAARQLSRGQRRRRAREARVARSSAEAAPSTSEVVARTAEQRRVLDAVLSLDEIHREAILLRYFENLPPRRIAGRLGIPVDTVRSRIEHGRAKLARRLDADHGGDGRAWRLALLPVLAAPCAAATSVSASASASAVMASTTAAGTTGPSSLTAFLTAGGLMTAKLKIAGGVGLGLVLLLVAFSRLDLGPASPSASPDGEPPTTLVAEAPSSRSEEPGPPVGVEAPEPRRTSVAVDPQVGVLLFGSARDTEGRPVDTGWITLVNDEGEGRTASFGRNGSYSALGLRSGTWQLETQVRGYYPIEMPITIPDETSIRHDLLFEPAVKVRVRFEDENGDPVPAPDERGSYRSYDGLIAVATKQPPGDTLGGITGKVARRYGAGEFSDKTSELELRTPPPVYVSAVQRSAVLETVYFEGGTDELVLVVPKEQYEGSFGRVRVRVLDRDTKEPPPALSLAIGHTQTSGIPSKADPNGVVEVDRVAPGVLSMQVLLSDYEWMRKHFVVRPGETTDLGTILISKRSRVTGRFVDSSGKGQQMRFTVLTPRHLGLAYDASTRMQHQSDIEGRFELSSYGQDTILIKGPLGSDPVVHTWLVDASAGEVNDVELVLRPTARVRVLYPSDLPAGANIALLDEHGHPVSVVPPYRAVHFELPAGRYEVRIVEDDRVGQRAAFTVEEGVPMTVDLR